MTNEALSPFFSIGDRQSESEGKGGWTFAGKKKGGLPGGPILLTLHEAQQLFVETAQTKSSYRIALVPNPAYVYWPFELYALSPPKESLKTIKAVVMDMDGTTTTTEPLCLHSLEYTVRVLTGWSRREEWKGFDQSQDLPHLIGDSTTRHVEYLVNRFGRHFLPERFAKAFLWSSAWTLSSGKDPSRKQEAKADLSAFDLGGVWEEENFLSWGRSGVWQEPPSVLNALVQKTEKRLCGGSLPDRVRAAVTIYYQRYHQILSEIACHGKSKLWEEEGQGPPIAPMPQVPFFIALAKGLLGEEAPKGAEILECEGKELENLLYVSRFFEISPAKLALVTSSIRYEAEIVLGEVLRLARQEISGWPISEQRKQRIFEAFRSPAGLYDAFITASDSSEIRLKPHRDLYTMAFQRLGLAPQDYPHVLGLEDSTAGVIAMKAAGCGLAVALPFTQTSQHDFSAADHVVEGGVRELLLRYRCFLGS